VTGAARLMRSRSAHERRALRRDGDDWLLDVRVQPRASRTEFAGLHGERLKVRLLSPPWTVAPMPR
jgi:uncharacterized protein YggU (UPF0235/DUF167 family)